MKGRALTHQSFNKLAAIYRLCAALEVEPTDVLPCISVVSDRSSPHPLAGQDGKSPDNGKTGIKGRDANPQAGEGGAA